MGSIRLLDARAPRLLLSILIICICSVTKTQAVSPVTRNTQSNSHEFAPKFQHQPPNTRVELNKPHTIECAVESEPQAEIKWFKDNQLLASEPTHLEQSGSDLMFFQVLPRDSGEYQCEATNYLGTVKSDIFTLSVQSTIEDPRIRVTPELQQVKIDEPVEFVCSLPIEPSIGAPNGARRPHSAARAQWLAYDVSWRRNGRPLQVRWLDGMGDVGGASDDGSHAAGMHLGRQLGTSKFSLIVARPSLRDDNATFTCLFRDPADETEESMNHGIPHESHPARLRVAGAEFKLPNPDLGAPIDEILNNSLSPTTNNNKNSTTTTITEVERPPLVVTNLNDYLYVIVKPVVVAFALLAILIIILLKVLLAMHWRCPSGSNAMMYQQHKYPWHLGAGSGASSVLEGAGASTTTSCGIVGTGGGSSNSSSEASGSSGDPVLRSLLARTSMLSAQSSASLFGGAGSQSGKRFRSYRDNMRKVAAAAGGGGGHQQLEHHDLVDGPPSLWLDAKTLLPLESCQANNSGGNQLLIPSLFDHQHGDQMRSLSNLNLLGLSNHHQNNQTSRTTAMHTQQQHLQQHQQQHQHVWTSRDAFGMLPRRGCHPQQEPQQANLYSTIDTADDYSIYNGNSSSATATPADDQQMADFDSNSAATRYEHVQDLEQPISHHQHQQQHQPVSRNLLPRTSTFAVELHDNSDDSISNSKRLGRRQHHDQLSPYAVSSILRPNDATSEPQQQPPPVTTSEAMRALDEQFNINRLVLLEQQQHQRDNNKQKQSTAQSIADFAFGSAPPPPPPPPIGGSAGSSKRGQARATSNSNSNSNSNRQQNR